jgi:hypothetical protein
MKRSWKIAALVGLTWAVAAFAAEISIDYRQDADFTKYKTFAWQTGIPAPNPEMDKFILAKLEVALTAAGFKRVNDLRAADLHIIYSVSLSKSTQTETVEKMSLRTGLPEWDYSPFVRQGTSVNQTDLTEGTLKVDVEEGGTSTLLWSGVASKYLVAEGQFKENQKLVEQAIRLMLKDFPPKKGKPAAK